MVSIVDQSFLLTTPSSPGWKVLHAPVSFLSVPLEAPAPSHLKAEPTGSGTKDGDLRSCHLPLTPCFYSLASNDPQKWIVWPELPNESRSMGLIAYLKYFRGLKGTSYLSSPNLNFCSSPQCGPLLISQSQGMAPQFIWGQNLGVCPSSPLSLNQIPGLPWGPLISYFPSSWWIFFFSISPFFSPALQVGCHPLPGWLCHPPNWSPCCHAGPLYPLLTLLPLHSRSLSSVLLLEYLPPLGWAAQAVHVRVWGVRALTRAVLSFLDICWSLDCTCYRQGVYLLPPW